MKAILISLILAINPVNVRSDIGMIVNSETIQTTNSLWNYDTALPPGTTVVITFNTNGTETVVDDEIIKVEEVISCTKDH